MNKLQKLVCKVFGIKQNITVSNTTFNDPSKCDNVCEMNGEQLNKELQTISLANSSDKVLLGTSLAASSLRFVPLAQSGKKKSQLKERTIVIRITEMEWDL